MKMIKNLKYMRIRWMWWRHITRKENLTNSTRREEEWDAWKGLHKSKHKVNEKIMTTIQKALKTWKLHECNEEISQRKWNLTKLNKEGRRMELEQKNKEKRKKKHKNKWLHKSAKSSQQANKHKERPWWRGVEKLYLKLCNSCALHVVNLELSGFVLGLLPLHPKKRTTKPTSLVFALVFERHWCLSVH